MHINKRMSPLELLLNASEEQLEQYCKDPLNRNICNSEEFYEQKSYLQIPLELLYFKSNTLEGKDMTWKEFYQRVIVLVNNPNVSDLRMFLIRAGRLLELKIVNVLYPNQQFTQKHADAAAYFGRLNVIIWLASKNIYPSEHGIEQARKNKHYAIVEWLALKGRLISRRHPRSGIKEYDPVYILTVKK